MLFAYWFVASWFGVSASPYRIPLIVDHGGVYLAVLHVEKKGIQFHETAISASRGGRIYVQRNDRRLFQYRFTSRDGSGLLPETVTARVRELVQSTQLTDMRTAPAVALRNRNAEGWYVRTENKVLAFTSEYGTEPPQEVVALFHELDSVAAIEKELTTVNDICMGFCYDPLAGLGFSNMNDRCGRSYGTRCK